MTTTKSTKRRKKAVPGDVLRIPLEDGQFSLAQVLEREMAFFDVKQSHFDTVDDLSPYKCLWRLWLGSYAVKYEPWPIIGHAPIRDELLEPVSFAMLDAINKNKYSVFFRDPLNPNADPIKRSTYEEVKDLEIAASWDVEHVEQRLNDHFFKRISKARNYDRVTPPTKL